MGTPYTPEQQREWLASLELRASSAGVAFYTDDDRVLLLKANYKPYWSFPGGIVDKGETPLQAAVREVREETGLEINPGDLTFSLVSVRMSDIAYTYQFVFEMEVDAAMFDSIVLEADEIEASRVVSRQDIVDGVEYFSQSVTKWARGERGYSEQVFGENAKNSPTA